MANANIRLWFDLCHGDYRGKNISLVNKQIRAQISFTGAR